MKNLVVVMLLLICFSGAKAQEVYNSSGKAHYKNKKNNGGYDADKLIIGGGMNLGFGNGYTRVGASPIVGYRLTKHFSAGVGLGYQYYKYPYDEFHSIYMNIVYPNLWARYFVYRNIFLSANYEYDIISLKSPLDRYGNFNETSEKATNNCMLLGVGFKQPLGGRVSFYGELYYDLLQGQYSPYPKNYPGIRFGIAAGF